MAMAASPSNRTGSPSGKASPVQQASAAPNAPSAPVLPPSEGCRGFRSFVPPPEGCVGWGKPKAEAKAGGPNRSPGANGSSRSRPSHRGSGVREKSRDAGMSPSPSSRSSSPTRGGAGERRNSNSFGMKGKAALPAKPPENATPLGLQLWAFKQELNQEPPQGATIPSPEQLQAASQKNWQELTTLDAALKETLEEDGGVIWPELEPAFKVYCSSLTAFDPSVTLRKLSFQAVIENDSQTLEQMLRDGDVDLDTKNSGGQTLLEVALERQREGCKTLLLQKTQERERQKEREKDGQASPRSRKSVSATRKTRR